MSSGDKQETKERIMKVAAELFSKYGFGGTSIREIAQASASNIAAINYHFGNKHNLYWSVVKASQERVEQSFAQLSAKNLSVEEMVVQVFGLVMQDKAAVRTTLKLLLSEGVPEADGEFAHINCDDGPPGAEYIKSAIRRQIDEPISDLALAWATRSIFGSLVHWSMICASTKIEVIRKTMPEMNEVGIKAILRLHARAIIEYTKNHHAEIAVDLHH